MFRDVAVCTSFACPSCGPGVAKDAARGRSSSLSGLTLVCLKETPIDEFKALLVSEAAALFLNTLYGNDFKAHWLSLLFPPYERIGTLCKDGTDRVNRSLWKFLAITHWAGSVDHGSLLNFVDISRIRSCRILGSNICQDGKGRIQRGSN